MRPDNLTFWVQSACKNNQQEIRVWSVSVSSVYLRYADFLAMYIAVYCDFTVLKGFGSMFYR